MIPANFCFLKFKGGGGKFFYKLLDLNYKNTEIQLKAFLTYSQVDFIEL